MGGSGRDGVDLEVLANVVDRVLPIPIHHQIARGIGDCWIRNQTGNRENLVDAGVPTI